MISVVLPVLDEEEEIAPALAHLRTVAATGRACDVVVVDGGSTDATPARALHAGARVVFARRGRAAQMNAGARAARGDVLLFLHVDARLPQGGLRSAEDAMKDSAVVVGGFTKSYVGSGSPVLPLLARLLDVRARRGHLVGTQAMFVRRSAFEGVGGYRDWPLLEDVDLCDRLRRRGRVVVLGDAVLVSARRYARRGVARQAAANAAVLALFRMGVAPARLERLYRGGARTAACAC